MSKKLYKAALIFLIMLVVSSSLCAQNKKGMGMRPATVVLSEVRSGMITPKAEFIGTVYYKEVSDTASEVNGKIEKVYFEEGDRVKRGEILVKLNADILESSLKARQASYEEILVELERARLDLKRKEVLYKDSLISEEEYDEYRFRVKGLKKKVVAISADVESIKIEISKKHITAPFSGVVISRHVDTGEWLSPGSMIASIAKDSVVDIKVNIPERLTPFIKIGAHVDIISGGHRIKGRVLAVIPRADVSTRTIPLKIRTDNSLHLIEGMEARVRLPMGARRRSLVVDRDAVTTMSGKTYVFFVKDMTAHMLPVKVVGYEGMMAGIYSPGLKKDMKVVIKGNERLKDGQPVMVLSGKR